MSNHLFDNLLASRINDDRVFLYLTNGTHWTYSEIISLSGQIAKVLVDHGANPGDRIVIQVQKSPEAIALYLATLRAGLILVPLNISYTSDELDYFIEDAEPVIFICDTSQSDVIASITEHRGIRILTLDTKGGGSLIDKAHLSSELDPVSRSPNDLAAILYTSGTTGRSKGAMLSHENLLSNALSLADTWRFTDKDVLLHALPIFHTHGLFVAVNVIIAAAGSIIFIPNFDLDDIVSFLPKATAFMGIPTFYNRLMNHPGFTAALVGHMRLFISGSAPLLVQTNNDFASRNGMQILERYGMTEANIITSNPYEGERRAGTVGFSLPSIEIRVCDPETAIEVKPGDIGVIEVKGPNVFLGYWNMPKKTEEEFRPDGFFITGDLGQIDSDGYLKIVGRSKDLIISGGLNVYPKEIETKINEITGVEESAVIGVPHSDLGEGVIALVVTKSDADISETQILDAISDRLARFKQPKKIIFTDELPRNAMGKVQKNMLSDSYFDFFDGT